MKSTHGLRKLLLLPALIVLLLVMVIPYITMLVMPAADPEPAVGEALWRILGDDRFQEIAMRTLRVALISTLLSVLLGFPVAYYLSKAPERWRGLLLIAVTFPLLLNTVVRTFAWLVVLGSQGVVSQALQFLGFAQGPVQLLYTETALVIGLTQLFTPILILTAYSSLSGIHPHIEQAAAGLGAGPSHTFIRIIFPLALPEPSRVWCRCYAGIGSSSWAV